MYSARFVLPFLVIYLFGSAAKLAQASEASRGWRSLPLVTKGKLDTNWVHIGYGGWTVDEGTLKTKPDARGAWFACLSKGAFR